MNDQVRSIEGIAEEALPGGMFRVKISADTIILAHLSGKMRIHRIRIVPGDRVLVEMSPYDQTRGRIVRRF